MSSDAEANLDEFLNLLENGEEDKAEINVKADCSPVRKELSELTYEDVFGSPSPDKKKKRRTEGPVQNEKLSLSEKKSSSKINVSKSLSFDMFESEPDPKPSISNKTKTFAAGINTDQCVIDHFTRLRVFKTSIAIYCDESMAPESALKDRNLGMQFVSLMTMNLWYRTKKGEEKNIWTSGVLVRKQPGVRKSARGNEYVIWEINDLKELEKCWTVFLFSGATSSTSLMALPIGSLIDISSPSIMDSNSSNGTLKFSISNANQIRLIATAKDFGYCQGKRKDGKDCNAIVNTWECHVCIYHAPSELRKMNGKKSSSFYSANNKIKPGGNSSSSEPQMEGVVTLNFGKSMSNKKLSNSNLSQQPQTSFIPVGLKKTRMELEGSSVCSELKRNTLSMGNASSVSFKQETHSLLINEPIKTVPTKPLNLDPFKTRHLTERDREILSALDLPKANSTKSTEKDLKNSKSSVFNQDIAVQIASNPSAGGLNLMKYLSKPDAYSKNPNSTRKADHEPIALTRKSMLSMKKALEYVKSKGPIKKEDPNSLKRKSTDSKTICDPSQGRSKKSNIEVEFDFESDDFKTILNAKSAHEDSVNDIKEEEYFNKLTVKEAIENKLLNTFSVPTNAVMCRDCKYVALSQSDYCKDLAHSIRIVKATKRFFKCKDCGNRTMSLDRMPKHPCKSCKSSSWLAAPLGKEKKGPVLASEVLSLRGNEEKFIGSSSSKMFLNLEV